MDWVRIPVVLPNFKKERTMIDYTKTNVGDVLRIVGEGASMYAELGDLVRVKRVHANSVFVENRDGVECEFVFNCGAARLEVTEWNNEFPEIK